MVTTEFDDQFDLHFNNITSNQAPGLNTYEKSVFLTKAQDEIVKNYFIANSRGNNVGQGYDDSAKRQADFSALMKTDVCTAYASESVKKIDDRSQLFTFPSDVFIIVNETIKTTRGAYRQVIPLRFDEYTRLMSKPFKRPLKNQAWRLNNSGNVDGNTSTKYAEIILGVGETVAYGGYSVRYVKKPAPIILGDLDGLTINGKSNISECQIDPILHEDILQRAVELAKIAWTSQGNENTQLVMQAGQRSE